MIRSGAAQLIALTSPEISVAKSPKSVLLSPLFFHLAFMVLRSIVLKALTMSAPECAPLQNCTFCNIITENDPSKIIYQDDEVVAFPDIKPAAEHHYLVVPRAHLPNARDLDASNKSLVEHMIKVGGDILAERNVEASNSRLGFHWPPFNTISHLHLHAIAPADKMNFVSRLIFRPDSYWFVTTDYVLSRL